ncbi:MAG: gliding motility-associated C-terminal domain-containing protein, partial [Bacteroidales bacterium]|nr:gliding motility-associated C-terminal domain-containing protein [Bacteroidales bacterium]
DSVVTAEDTRSDQGEILLQNEQGSVISYAEKEKPDEGSGEVLSTPNTRVPAVNADQDNVNRSDAGDESATEEMENNQDGDHPGIPRESSTQGTLVTFFTSSVQSGCAPLMVRFFNHSVNETARTWSFGTGEPVKEKDPEYEFAEPGKYTVTLTAEDADGQTSLYQQIIEVYPSPSAEFEIEEGLESTEGLEQLDLVNYSVGAFSYTWNLLSKSKSTGGDWSSNEFQPVLKVTDLDKETGFLQLVATNEYGCIDTSVLVIPSFTVSVIHALQFPTAFSPSNTGPGGGHYSPHEKRIDVFHPVFEQPPPVYRLRIYTRRGELVFETENIYIGWDGYYLQERSLGGVYVWMAEGSWENGEEFKLQGDVTLLWGDQR